MLAAGNAVGARGSVAGLLLVLAFKKVLDEKATTLRALCGPQ